MFRCVTQLKGIIVDVDSFYSCGNCRSSLNYDVGIRSIQDIVDKDVTRDDDEDSLL